MRPWTPIRPGGFEDDVTVAAELNCDDVAPKLDGGAFRSSIRGSPPDAKLRLRDPGSAN